MLRSSVMLVLWALGSVALAADPTLAPGTRVRLRTVGPSLERGGRGSGLRGSGTRGGRRHRHHPAQGRGPATRTKKGRWLVGEEVVCGVARAAQLLHATTALKLRRRFVTRRWSDCRGRGSYGNEPEAGSGTGGMHPAEATRGLARSRGPRGGAGVGASFCALFAAIAPSSEGIGTRTVGRWRSLRRQRASSSARIIGSSALGEKWRPVDGARLRGTVGPSPGGGVRAALTVGF